MGAVQPPAQAPVVVPAPVAEPGTSTSEWKTLIGGVVASGAGLAVALGAPLSQAQENAILAFVGSVVALGGAYVLSRGIRKAGTSA